MTANDSTPNPLQPLADALAPLLLRHLDKRVEATAGDAAQAAIDDYEPDFSSEVEEAVNEALSDLSLSDLDGVSESDVEYLIERAVEGIDTTPEVDSDTVYRALSPWMDSLLSGSDCSDGDPFRAALLSVVSRGLGIDLGTTRTSELAQLTRRKPEELSGPMGVAAPRPRFGVEGWGWGDPQNPSHPVGWLISKARDEQELLREPGTDAPRLRRLPKDTVAYPSPWLTGDLGGDPSVWPTASRLLWQHRQLDNPADLSGLQLTDGPDVLRGPWLGHVGTEVFERLRAIFAVGACEVVTYTNPDGLRRYAASPIPLEVREGVSYAALSGLRRTIPVLGLRSWVPFSSADSDAYPPTATLIRAQRRGMGTRGSGVVPAVQDCPGAWNTDLLMSMLGRAWDGWASPQLGILARRLRRLSGLVLPHAWAVGAWDQSAAASPAARHLGPLLRTPVGAAWTGHDIEVQGHASIDWSAGFTILDDGKARTAFPFDQQRYVDATALPGHPDTPDTPPRAVTLVEYL